jgi:cytoskeletal protein CcmA (bactofilin family)
MADATVLGPTSFVRGRVHGSGDLTIMGRVEGEVTTTGDVVIDTSGLVAANVTASRIVVRGAVRGDLSAEDTLHVEAGAKVVGNLRAPRVAIAPGGLVRGHVETASTPNRAAAPRAAARPATVPTARATEAAVTPRVAAAPAARAPATTRIEDEPVKRNAPTTNHANASSSKGARGSALAGTRPAGPPPPVVPVLKKGTKAVQKKRG